MRKQATELRRYRRLTSAGRISLAPPSRSVSAQLSVIASADDDSMISEVDERASMNLESFSDEDDVSSLSLSTGTMTPSTQATHDERQQQRDAKRLQIDLTKHKEMLIDSQRINQSLKRCLGWTEELIAEGKKALAYQVKVSDVEMGGRVLFDDEVDEEMSQSRGLLSPAHEMSAMDWDNAKRRSTGSSNGVHDMTWVEVEDNEDTGGTF